MKATAVGFPMIVENAAFWDSPNCIRSNSHQNIRNLTVPIIQVYFQQWQVCCPSQRYTKRRNNLFTDTTQM